MPSEIRRLEVDLSPAEVPAALGGAAEIWGGSWRSGGDGTRSTGGTLELPVSAGLRHGLLLAEVAIEPSGRGASVAVSVTEERYRLHTSAFVISCLGALGGVTLVLWPLVPRLAGLAPLAFVLAFSAWFLVTSRVRNASLTDFLELAFGDATTRDEPGEALPPPLAPG